MTSLLQLLRQAGATDAAQLLIDTLTQTAVRQGFEAGEAADLAQRVAGSLYYDSPTPAPSDAAGKLLAEWLSSAGRPATVAEPAVTEHRPEVLECDVVRFQNNKEKWVALVGLLDGRPYEIFTGLQDDDEGIVLPKTVTKGRIIKTICADGTKRYDFQFQNKRGYKMTVEGLSEKFNKEYWNYAKLISGVLRYRMPIAHVIKLVDSLQLESESINTWKAGVSRALKKYLNE